MTEDDKNFERIWDALLNETELLAQEGITTFEMARGMAAFVVDLAFDCAPSSEQATHLLLQAIQRRLEADVEERINE